MRLENWLYILGAGLLVTIVFMARYNGIDAGLYQVRDDGVITMSAGRHIVDYGFVGISPSGPIVEASSSPLQMIVYATVYALSEAAYTTFAKYQTIFTTFLLGASLGLIFLESRTAGLCTILLVSLGLSAVYPFFLWHGSGMENAITHALLVLSIAGLVHMIRTEKIAYVWAIPLVLTCFSRLELLPTILVLLGAFSLFWYALHRRTDGFGLFVLVFGACIGIHLLRFSYFGDFFPNTADAQGISPVDKLRVLLTGSMAPIYDAFPVTYHNFFRSGWWIATLSLPLAILLKKNRQEYFLIATVLVVLFIAAVSPVLLGFPRIDWGRTYSHVAPVAFLLPAWCIFRALMSRSVFQLAFAVLILGTAGNWMSKNEPYYLGWAVDDFDETRQEFASLAKSNDIQRALVANPDLGVMSWHKEFNILDLGMLGSPVIARLHQDPVVADYILDFAKPDLVESHGYWTKTYCENLFLDPRFWEYYRPVTTDIEPKKWCNNPSPQKVIWIRRSIELGFNGKERRFLESLQNQLKPESIKTELDTCDREQSDCSYIVRTVFRFVPELSAQGALLDVIKLFPDELEQAYLSTTLDSAATGKIIQHYLKE